MEKKSKKTIWTREQRERWEYNAIQFKRVLADGLRQKGASPEEIRRRLGDLNSAY